VLALFAPDAIVRERRGAVPPHVWDTRDPQVVRAYLAAATDGDDYSTGGLVWAAGRPWIAAWASAAFGRRHRFAVGPSRAAGDTVRWRYHEFVDPYQLAPAMRPAEGDAEAVVRGGRIVRLSLVRSPASVQRSRDERRAAGAWAVATRRAAPLADGPRLPLRGPPRGGPAAEPTDAAWPLVLGGLALLAAGAAALRRRRLP
jgi:MYXO-CTERM domain-containing protein